MKKLLIVLSIVFSISLNSKSSHIVGGNTHVEQIGPNTFVITLKFSREWCNNTNAEAPDSIPVLTFFGFGASVVLYDNLTNVPSASFSLPLFSRDTVLFGDACFTPTGICVEVSTYKDTFSIANNPNGYYLTWAIGNRNAALTNMSPGGGAVWQAQIPDPAISGFNSNPKFGPYPSDGYFCINNVKYIDMSCIDSDGDSLVYSLVQPASSGTTRPLTPLNFSANYNIANILGPGSLLTINPNTGIVTARPGTAGVFVFQVKCEEYRGGVKIGEVFNELQYEALNCAYDLPPSIGDLSSKPVTTSFESLYCYDVFVSDANPTDTFNLVVNSNAFPYGLSASLPNDLGGGSYVFSYLDTNGNIVNSPSTSVNQINDSSFIGVGAVGARVCWEPKDCEVYNIDTFRVTINAFSKGCDLFVDTLSVDYIFNVNAAEYSNITPNVFSPNGDGKNDKFHLQKDQYNKCYDVLNVEIYNRWGQKIFESDNPLFEWDGKDKDGAKLNSGTYYVIMQGFFAGKEEINQFPVTLFR